MTTWEEPPLFDMPPDPPREDESQPRRTDMNDHFEIYQDKAGQWRWRLVADNGEIVADSAEGYVSEHNARRAVETVRQLVALPDSDE